MNKLYNILRTLKKDEILRLSRQTCKHGHNLLAHPQCIKQEHPEAVERVGYLDIEASNLDADFGYVISYCILGEDGKLYGRVLRRDEILGKYKDKKLVQECIEDMRKFDRLVTYYGGGFDLPFLRTRAVMWELDFPINREMFHTDVYQIIKHKFKLHRRRMEVACKLFKITAKTHPMEPDVWQAAAVGDKTALKYILDHNIEDVVSLKELFHRVNEHVRITGSSI